MESDAPAAGLLELCSPWGDAIRGVEGGVRGVCKLRCWYQPSAHSLSFVGHTRILRGARHPSRAQASHTRDEGPRRASDSLPLGEMASPDRWEEMSHCAKQRKEEKTFYIGLKS